MDTYSSIRHRFDVEIPLGKLVEITSILKGESTWKLWHRFDVDLTFKIDEISMSSLHGFFFVISTLNRCNFRTRCFHSIISKHFLLRESILSYSGIVLSWCNFNNIDVITDTGAIRTIFFGKFATTQIKKKDNFYFLQNSTNKDYNAKIYK